MSLWGLNLVELFQKAGMTRWAILLCSILALAIILDRTLYYFHVKTNAERFAEKLLGLLKARDVRSALKLATETRHPVGVITAAYLRHLKHPLRDKILSREGSKAIAAIERRLRGLAAITHIAPLLGLLGTVAGLVTTFFAIQTAGGQIQPELLAGGIWEALLSTVFGLLVAIPSMVAYYAFESFADQSTAQIQSVVSELDEFFGKVSLQDFTSSSKEEYGEDFFISG